MEPPPHPGTRQVNTLIMLLDLSVTRLPYYLKHGIHPLILLSVYLLFSVLYWAGGGTDPTGMPAGEATCSQRLSGTLSSVASCSPS